ncbi:alpha/beta fold hydrolase [Rhodococcoides fascians]|uniref:alpha/beta fold hydrolase n=1 Tax=Rhodococcoides fascians TaxID=1828 RepID=UPI00055C0503|nr:alpha/beta hydrolase [Rhodococcus fascians]
MFNVKQSAPGQFVTVDDLTTHVVLSHAQSEDGFGAAPTVVLCGGLASNWFDWDDCVRILSPFHTVVVFDRPGFGLSEPLPDDRVPTVADEAARILAVLDSLELTSPAVIVGHSIAGFYAEAFARLYPQRTAGVLLLDSSAERDPWVVLPKPWRVAGAHLLAAVASGSGLQFLLGPTVRRILNHSIPPDGIPLETLDWTRRIYRRRSYLKAALIEDFVYPDMAAELNEIRRRTRFETAAIVAAAHTGRQTPWGRWWLRKQARLAGYLGAEFAVVDHAHHHAMIDQPADVSALIVRLVSHHRSIDT